MQGNTFFGFSGGGGSTPPPVSNSWLLNGNTEGAEKYFGTNDNFSIPIYTNGSAIGVFLNTGDFGFGTIAPTSRVHIVGINSTSTNYALKIDNSVNSPLLYVRNDGNVYAHGFGDISSNTAFGLDALINVTGLFNTAYGTSALKTNTIGIGNLAFGFEALKVNTSGSYNVALGTQSLFSSVNGVSNTSIGNAAMAFNISGISNTAIGKSALYNSTNSFNTAIGVQALENLIGGQLNTSIGFQSGINSTGSRNVFIGALAGANETTNDKLYISNTFTSNPLIYGDFQSSILNVNGYLGVSNAIFSPTATIHAKGINSTSSNYALKVDNSASSPLLYVRNDGNVGIGTITPTAKLDVNGQIVSGLGGGVVTSNDSPFYAVRANTGAPNYYTGWQYTFEVGGGIWGIGMNYVNNQFQFLTNGASTGKFIFGDGNPATPNGKFLMDLNGGYFGSNTTSPTANIHAKGIDATSSNYALKIDNSASSPLLYVRNDGVSTFNTSSTYATNFGYDVKWQAFSNPSSSNGNYISLCTGGGSIFQSTFSRINGGVVKSEMYFIESNDTTYMAIGVIGDANKALSLRTNDTDRLFISHNGDIGISKNAMSARLHVFGVDATNSINQRLEPVTNVTEDTTGNTVVTTDATANVTSQTIAVPADKVISLESTIVYRKTGGAGVGVTGDGTTIKLNSSVKNVGGTLTLDTVQNTYTGTTNAIAGVSATYTISGTNVLVSVTGVLNDNITWNVITKVNTVA